MTLKINPFTAISGLVCCLIAVSLGFEAFAQEFGHAQGPTLEPRTGSYFELRIDNLSRIPSGYDHATWADAERRAASLTYRGRRGQLAIVDDRQTFDFIQSKFRIIHQTWIGLRYFCKFRKLVWVNGKIHPLSENQFWANPWYNNKRITCSNQNFEYMPVYLETLGKLRWRASGPKKFFTNYLVEYPPPRLNETNSGG